MSYTYKQSPRTLEQFYQRVEKKTGLTKEMLEAVVSAYNAEPALISERFSLYGGRDIAFSIQLETVGKAYSTTLAPKGTHRFKFSNYFLAQTRGWRGSLERETPSKIANIGLQLLNLLSNDEADLYAEIVECRTDATYRSETVKEALEYTRTVIETLIERYNGAPETYENTGDLIAE